MSKRNWQAEYRKQLAEAIVQSRAVLAASALTDEEVARAMEPMLSWQESIEEAFGREGAGQG